jgi:signal peptidase II
MIFDKGLHYDAAVHDYVRYTGVAKFATPGYSSFLHGSVVDMLYFPMFHGHFPSWIPKIGGEEFEFFSPIFNIADASISGGVITLLVFQKRFFKKPHHPEKHTTVETSSQVNDEMQIS